MSDKESKKDIAEVVRKAPAILKGVPVQDNAKLLEKAGAHGIRALMSRNFALWCQYSGLEVDGAKFSFDDHRYLLPIYMDDGHEVVWMKAAQLGATTYMLLRLLWQCRYLNDEKNGRLAVKAALYFPTGEGVETLSKDRLAPLIQSNKELSENLSEDVDTQGLKRIKNILDRESSLYMLYVGGRASKDSVPLDCLCFDEVRLIDPKDIDQCLKRTSHSVFKYHTYMSTAGHPGASIDARFDQGTQLVWTIKCNCRTGEGFVPSECFPDCIAEKNGEVYLKCPRCNSRIRDPQNGSFVARNPGADFNSYSVSQLIANAKYTDLKKVLRDFKTTTNLQEFYNAVLGMPYVDADNRPVTDDVFDSCINPDLKWAKEFRESRRVRSMGIDQHKGNCYAVVMEKGKDGRNHIVHLEVIDTVNPAYFKENEQTGELSPVTPFKRVHEMMEEFGVRMAICDSEPNANEAMSFANAFPRRVFLAKYKDSGMDMVVWADKLKTKESIRKGSKEIKLKYQVQIHRYQAIDFALRQWVEQKVLIPHPKRLEQVMANEKNGSLELQFPADRLRDHLKRMVRVQESLDKDGQNTERVRNRWQTMGNSGHFLHAYLFALISLERLNKKAIFVV
jgi:hypothetical protein